ncbi:hypothetical protein FJY68_14160 [candidate division WOR-3 bacterium]|uniref:Uncharacterized protein n=1 Tax=candidate division WOR-3 bacterium TaxID=2052148 RepID=A0A938BRA6_UNCW3|nr:hypothetical protein [candidate division WOR-3 bacterium]
MRTLRVVVALAAVACLFCAKKQTVQPPPGDKLLWTSESARPDWAYETPKATGGEHIVVGMSHKYADEKSCRDDAERDSRLRASRYLETAVRDAFEQVVAELGLAGAVLNPSVASRDYIEMNSQAVIQNSEVTKFYVEKWQSAETGEPFFLCFARLVLPDAQTRQSFSDYTNRKKQEWNMSQEQLRRVNEVFQRYWESKKTEGELKQGGE